MRIKVSDKALQLPNSYNHPSVTPNLSRFLQKLEFYSGDNAEVLHNHLKQSILKVKGREVDPNSKEVVTVDVSFFTGSLGTWAIDHADLNCRLESIDALTAYVRISFFIYNLEVNNLYY